MQNKLHVGRCVESALRLNVTENKWCVHIYEVG